MPPHTSIERYPQAIAAIESFFERFYGADVASVETPGEDGALFLLGAQRKSVLFSPDFLEFDSEEILQKLAAWNVAHLSRTLERRCRLLVTSEGPEEDRE